MDWESVHRSPKKAARWKNVLEYRSRDSMVKEPEDFVRKSVPLSLTLVYVSLSSCLSEVMFLPEEVLVPNLRSSSSCSHHYSFSTYTLRFDGEMDRENSIYLRAFWKTVSWEERKRKMEKRWSWSLPVILLFFFSEKKEKVLEANVLEPLRFSHASRYSREKLIYIFCYADWIHSISPLTFTLPLLVELF